MAEDQGFAADGRIALPALTLATHFGCSILAGSLLAIQVFIVLYGLSSFLDLPQSRRRGRWQLVAISLVILVVSGIDTSFDIRDYYLTLLVPGHSHASKDDKIFNLIGDVMLAINIVLGDGLMIWRCFILWKNRKWVIIAPSVFLVGSIGCYVAYLLAEDHVAYHKAITASAFLSVACNIIVTALIVHRLQSARKAAFLALPDQHSPRIYSRVMTIVVESAAPLAFFGICFAITSILSIYESGDRIQQAKRDSAHEVFAWLYYSFCALSPQMVIFRVINGMAYQDAKERQDGERMLSHPIHFAQRSTKETESWSMSDRV